MVWRFTIQAKHSDQIPSEVSKCNLTVMRFFNMDNLIPVMRVTNRIEFCFLWYSDPWIEIENRITEQTSRILLGLTTWYIIFGRIILRIYVKLMEYSKNGPFKP